MHVGIDMTYIPRFKDGEKLAKKILSQNELNEYYLSRQRDQYLASRFALKEAFLKSIKKGILGVDLSKIETIKEESGAIHIKFEDKDYPASLSHEKDYCIGVVIYD